jgi:hypothetical protein
MYSIGAGGVTNNDANFQSIFGGVNVAASQTWNAAAGGLQVDVIHFSAASQTLDGAHEIGMIGIITGSGAVRLDGSFTSTATIGDSLAQTVAFLTGQLEIEPTPSRLDELFQELSHYEEDFADVRGQEMAKRAVTIAAAGSNNLLMLGWITPLGPSHWSATD